MKALTIWQPYPALIIVGAKRYETRSWYTTYRGPIALHTSKKPVASVLNMLPEGIEDAARFEIRESMGVSLEDLPIGAVVATAMLVDCIKIDRRFWEGLHAREELFGDFSAGRYAWLLQDVMALPEPIPAIGKQGIWNWEP